MNPLAEDSHEISSLIFSEKVFMNAVCISCDWPVVIGPLRVNKITEMATNYWNTSVINICQFQQKKSLLNYTVNRVNNQKYI